MLSLLTNLTPGYRLGSDNVDCCGMEVFMFWYPTQPIDYNLPNHKIDCFGVEIFMFCYSM